MAPKGLYPKIAPYKSGDLQVSDTHTIHWDEYGKPDGEPVMVVHGGPGGGSQPEYAQYFDPQHYRIIQFDQRGCGKSTPYACLEENTTWDLVDDMVKLREDRGIKGTMHMFGGSWGSTLSLVYAINHPETVRSLTLRGIFLCRKEDIDFFYQGDAACPGNSEKMGAGRHFPEEWKEYVEHIDKNERDDMVAAYNKRLTSNNKEEQLAAAKCWALWEGATSKLLPNAQLKEKFEGAAFALPFARIENHYFINGAFLGAGGQSRDQNYILKNVHKIAHIAARIIHGRYDVVCPLNQATSLVLAWNAAQKEDSIMPELIITDGAGHSATEEANIAALVDSTDSFRQLDVAPF